MCPGKKFAQVEFVALTAALFWDHRVEPMPETGESVETTRKGMLKVAEDHGMFLLQQMRRAGRAGVRWGDDFGGWGSVCLFENLGGYVVSDLG